MCKNANKKNYALRPSFYEIERRARREQSILINAYMRMLARGFAEWLRALVQESARLARHLTAEGRGRAAVRALQQLDDRTLADIGVARSEIEVAVRSGQPVRTTRRQRQHVWSGPEAQKAA
jgi:uncharacterized protein YjiS (DUF1127 family)